MLGIWYDAFAWLPPLLQWPVKAVITLALLIIAMRVLKLVWDIISIFFSFFGGILSRVVSFFV